MVHQTIYAILGTLAVTLVYSLSQMSSSTTEESLMTKEISSIQNFSQDNQLRQQEAYSLRNITSYFQSSQFKGRWQSNANFNQFNFLTMTQGDVFMIFITNETLVFSTDVILINKMGMQLLNPTYQENREVFVELNLLNYNETNKQWIGQSELNYTGLYKFKEQNRNSIPNLCIVNYTVSLDFGLNNPSAQSAIVSIRVQTIEQSVSVCSVDFTSTLTQDNTNYQLQVILYCLFIVTVCGVQFVSVTKLCKEFMENEQDVQKLSLITVGYITVYDAYLCLQNLYFALLKYYYFQYFIIPAFFYFLLSTTCDMKLIWIIWRARYLNVIFDNQQMRRAITIFFIQFYSSLILFFILMFFFDLQNWFILLTSLFIFPQIVHNAMRGNNPKFISKYVFGIIATNIFYPLYFRAIPFNFRGLEPSTVFCTIWVSLFFIQILILFIQFRFGPRSLIPKCFLPKQFNYYQNLQVNIEQTQSFDQTDDCAICLGNVLQSPDQINQNANDALLQRIMVTPCKHKFHIECLKSWMDIKLQCPTCRKTIPPLNL